MTYWRTELGLRMRERRMMMGIGDGDGDGDLGQLPSREVEASEK